MAEDRFVPPLRQRVIIGWFALNGFVVASWVAHIPRGEYRPRGSSGTLGLALLCMVAGSVLGMVVAPWAIRRSGAGRAARVAGARIRPLPLPLPLSAGSVFTLAAGLLLFGAAHGLLDVAMNKAAADHEQTLGQACDGRLSRMVQRRHGGRCWSWERRLSSSVSRRSSMPLSSSFWPWACSRPGTCKSSSHKLATGQPQAVGRGGRRERLSPGLRSSGRFGRSDGRLVLGVLAVAFGAGPAAAPLADPAFTACWAVGRFVGDRLTSQTGDVFIVRAGAESWAAVGVGLGLVGGTPVWVMAGLGVDRLGNCERRSAVVPGLPHGPPSTAEGWLS